MFDSSSTKTPRLLAGCASNHSIPSGIAASPSHARRFLFGLILMYVSVRQDQGEVQEIQCAGKKYTQSSKGGLALGDLRVAKVHSPTFSLFCLTRFQWIACFSLLVFYLQILKENEKKQEQKPKKKPKVEM
jgi:hypothetical protein